MMRLWVVFASGVLAISVGLGCLVGALSFGFCGVLLASLGVFPISALSMFALVGAAIGASGMGILGPLRVPAWNCALWVSTVPLVAFLFLALGYMRTPGLFPSASRMAEYIASNCLTLLVGGGVTGYWAARGCGAVLPRLTMMYDHLRTESGPRPERKRPEGIERRQVI